MALEDKQLEHLIKSKYLKKPPKYAKIKNKMLTQVWVPLKWIDLNK